MKDKAILFEKLGKSRTFLLYDEDAENFEVLGYFTLAIQVLKIPSALSNRKIKNLDGFNAKVRGDKITELPAILIGQLAKNDLFSKALSGDDLMDFCLATLLQGQGRIGGRIILLECKDIPYLITFYEKFGFSKIDKDYEEGALLQFVKVLSEDDIIQSESPEKH